mgnify:CR=1 FL=1
MLRLVGALPPTQVHSLSSAANATGPTLAFKLDGSSLAVIAEFTSKQRGATSRGVVATFWYLGYLVDAAVDHFYFSFIFYSWSLDRRGRRR